MTIKVTDEEQGKLVHMLKGLNKGITPFEKKSFLNNIGLFLSSGETFLNNFISIIFSTKNRRRDEAPKKTPKPTPEKAPELKPKSEYTQSI